VSRLAILGLLALTACSVVNQKALDAWMSSDKDMMADLDEYRKAAGKDTKDIDAHVTKTIDQITAEEESLLMTELLADIKNDPKRSARRKASYPVKIDAHMNLFNSMKGGN